MQRTAKHESIETSYSVVICVVVAYLTAIHIGWLATGTVLVNELEKRYSGTSLVAAQAGLVASLLAFMSCVTNWLFAILIPMIGLRKIATAAGIIAACSVALSSFTSELVWWIATYSIPFGLSSACIFSACSTIQPHYFDRHQGLVAGISSCAVGVMTFIYPILWTTLLSRFGFEVSMYIFAGILGSVIFPIVLLKKPNYAVMPAATLLVNDGEANLIGNDMPNTIADTTGDSSTTENRSVSESENDRDALVSHEASTSLSRGQRLKELLHVHVLRNKTFIFMSIGIATAILGESIVTTHLISFANTYYPEENTNILISVMGIGQAASKLFSAWLVDHLSLKVSYYIIQIGIIFCAIVTLTLSFIISGQLPFYFAVIAMVAYGVVDSPIYSMPFPIVCRFMQRKTIAISMGYQIILIGIAALIGPPGAGLLFSFTASYALCYRVAAIPFLCGSIIMFLANFDRDCVRSS